MQALEALKVSCYRTRSDWSSLLQILHHQPCPKETKDQRSYWLQPPPPPHNLWLWGLLRTTPLLDPLHFAFRANRSEVNAVTMDPPVLLQHLDPAGPRPGPGLCYRTSSPSCMWITDFLSDRSSSDSTCRVSVSELTGPALVTMNVPISK